MFYFAQENGVQMKIDGDNRTFRGSIGPFSGDNLGQHLIGGFSESFNTLRVCRICMGSMNEIQVKVIIYNIILCSTHIGWIDVT